VAAASRHRDRDGAPANPRRNPLDPQRRPESRTEPHAEDVDAISSPCAFPPHTEEDRHQAYSSDTYLPAPSPNRASASAPLRQNAPVKLAQCFLRLSNFDNGLFERIGRYETAIWRQVGQTLLTLQAVRRLR